MEKVSFEIEINGITKSINSINDAKEAISELQDIMDNSTFGSEEFKNAATQIDKLQNKLVEALDKGVEPATDGFKKLKNELKEAKNAQAQAAEAFGEGSKEYKKAAQQVANLQDKLEDLKDSSVSLKGTGVERLNSSVGLLREGFQNFDTDKLKIGFSALGTAMKAIPIFLIIEGVRYLIENFDELSKGNGILAKSLQGVSWVINKLKEEIYAFTDALGLTNSALEKQGDALKTNADKASDALNRQTGEYDLLIDKAKASGKSAVDLEIAKQQAIIETNKKLVEQTIAYVRAGGQLDEEQKKLLTDQLDTIKKAANQIEVIKLQEEQKRKEDFAKRKAENKKQQDDLFAEALKEQEKEEEIRSWRIKKEEEANKLEAANRAKVLEEMKALELKVMQEENQAKIDAWNEEERLRKLAEDNYKKSEDAKKEALSKSLDAGKGLVDAFFANQLNQAKGNATRELAIKKRMFEVDKAFNVARAIQDGIRSVQAALTIPPPGGQILAGVNATIAAGNVAKILATKFDGGTTSSNSGDLGVPAVSGNAPQFNSIAPNINPSSNQPLTRLDENGRPINVNTSVKVEAEVTESKMTDKQKQQQQRINNTTF